MKRPAAIVVDLPLDPVRHWREQGHQAWLRAIEAEEDQQVDQRRTRRPPERGEAHAGWGRDLGPVWEQATELAAAGERSSVSSVRSAVFDQQCSISSVRSARCG